MLVPREGYIESIDHNGRPYYKPTRKTLHQEELAESLRAENNLLKAQLQAQTERSDFIEDCIAEMATVVYGGE